MQPMLGFNHYFPSYSSCVSTDTAFIQPVTPNKFKYGYEENKNISLGSQNKQLPIVLNVRKSKEKAYFIYLSLLD